MSRNDSISIRLYEEADICALIEGMSQAGWTLIRECHFTVLPVGDKDDYNWSCQFGNITALQGYVSKKLAAREEVGIQMFWQETDEYLLMRTRAGLEFDFEICEKKYLNKSYYQLDLNMYFSRLLPCFETNSIEMMAYLQL